MVIVVPGQPGRMAANLAPVFLDDARVSLQGDPRPNVKKIVIAVGKSPDDCTVYQLSSQGDTAGRQLGMDEVIDRTLQVDAPVYLRCETQSEPGTRPSRSRKPGSSSTPASSSTESSSAPPAPAPSAPEPTPGGGTTPSPPQGLEPASPPPPGPPSGGQQNP